MLHNKILEFTLQEHIFELIMSPKSYHYIYKKAVQLNCIAFFILESYYRYKNVG